MKRRLFLKCCSTVPVLAPLSGCGTLRNIRHTKSFQPKGVMPTKVLGKTGMKVSLLGFGSHLCKELIANPKLRDKMIKRGYEGGINIFDVYDHSGYKQFKPMGETLKGFRKNVYVSLCITKEPGQMQNEIDGALNDFFTDYIDLYRFYTVDYDDEKMNIMEKNKKAGKIRAIGIVGHDVGTIENHLERYGAAIDYAMIIYNFHHNIAIILGEMPPNDYTQLIPRLEKLGIGILGMKPMGSDNMVELARKEGFYKDKKANISQAMLRYVFQAEEIDSTLSAMNSVDEVITNLDAVYNPALSPYENSILEKLSVRAASTKGAYLPDHYKWLETWATKSKILT